MMPSGSELMVILLAVLLLFGGGKIKDIARNIGKGIRELQKASRDFQRELNLDEDDHEDHKKPDLQG